MNRLLILILVSLNFAKADLGLRLKELSSEWGIIYFEQAGCPACEFSNKSLDLLLSHYNFEIRHVSREGFNGTVQDNGIIDELGITGYPMLYLVNKQNQQLALVCHGGFDIQTLVLNLNSFIEYLEKKS